MVNIYLSPDKSWGVFVQRQYRNQSLLSSPYRNKCVVVATAVECVVMASAIKHVVAAAVECMVAPTAVERMVACSAVERTVTHPLMSSIRDELPPPSGL